MKGVVSGSCRGEPADVTHCPEDLLSLSVVSTGIRDSPVAQATEG